MKCKAQRVMKDDKEIEIAGKGGTKRRAATGLCEVCGTKMFKFLPKKTV